MKIPVPDLGRLTSRLPRSDRLDRLGSRAGRITRSGQGRPDGNAPRHSALSRLTVVFLVVGVGAAAVLYDQVQGSPVAAGGQAEPTFITPSITDPAALDGAWYCPMGASGPDGIVNPTIHISNVADTTAVANVIPMTEEGRGPVVRVDLAPLTTTDFSLTAATTSPVAGAVVEIIGGAGVVGHTVQTDFGPADGTCSTHVSSTWYFASGRTTRDAKQYLALMNPFPEDVRYNVEFFRSAGRPRKPAALTGQEVPANSVKIIEVGEYVAREDAVAAAITTDRGRLVVERLETLSGDLGPSGAALQLGVTNAATSWMLPAGRIHEGGDDRVVVFNPSPDATATVDVELWPQNPTDRSLYGLGPIPRELLPGRFEVIDLRSEADRFGLRLPFEVGVSVTSSNDVPVVVERWQLAKQIDTSLIGAGGDAVAGSGASDGTADPNAADPAAGDPNVADPGDDPAAGGDGGLDPGVEGQLDLPGIFGQESEPLIQPTANVGFSTSRGTEVLSTRWVVPWVPTPAENASVVVVTSPTRASIEVSILLNGELQGPFRAEIQDGGRALVTLPMGPTGGPVIVTADAPVSVEAQVVLPDSRLATLAGVPTVVP